MGGKASKAKGSGFERELCRKLSLWVSGGKSKDLFWRSSQSGGRATTLRKKGGELNHQAGDLAAIHPDGFAFADTFFVEAKSYKRLDLDLLVYGRGKLVAMWKKCCKQGWKCKKMPLMIVKENARRALVFLPLLSGCFGPVLLASFPNVGFWTAYLDNLLRLDPEDFIHGGKNANSTYFGSAPDRPAKRRLSLGLLE
jgi:hypothetical protein